jgi:hypothetical protein
VEGHVLNCCYSDVPLLGGVCAELLVLSRDGLRRGT